MGTLRKLNKKAADDAATAIKAQREARSAIARAALIREADRLAGLKLRGRQDGDLRDHIAPSDLEVLPYLERGIPVDEIAGDIGMMPSEIWQTIMRLL